MKVVDLFAGCGGLSLGFQNAGYDIIAAYDFWQPAVNVYRDNFTSHSIYQMDLSDTDAAVRHIKPFAPDMISVDRRVKISPMLGNVRKAKEQV